MKRGNCRKQKPHLAKKPMDNKAARAQAAIEKLKSKRQSLRITLIIRRFERSKTKSIHIADVIALEKAAQHSPRCPTKPA
jgi:hypothetical protein